MLPVTSTNFCVVVLHSWLMAVYACVYFLRNSIISTCNVWLIFQRLRRLCVDLLVFHFKTYVSCTVSKYHHLL